MQNFSAVSPEIRSARPKKYRDMRHGATVVLVSPVIVEVKIYDGFQMKESVS